MQGNTFYDGMVSTLSFLAVLYAVVITLCFLEERYENKKTERVVIFCERCREQVFEKPSSQPTSKPERTEAEEQKAVLTRYQKEIRDCCSYYPD